MKRSIQIFSLIFAISLFASEPFAQTDDVRQASGLPIPIGGNSGDGESLPLMGRVTLQGLAAGEKRPSVYVVLFSNGARLDRQQANDSGHYYFPKAPRSGVTVAVEVEGQELSRSVLMPAIGGSLRHDVTINLPASRRPVTGVISAGPLYDRSDENEQLLERAMTLARENKRDEAELAFKQVLENDDKDFIAWTELGSLYFGASKFADSEAAYNKALGQKPDYLVALMNLGKLQMAQKQFERAVAVFYRAATVEPTSADAFHYLGESYLQAKQGSKAVIALNEALRLAPSEKADIHLRLAALYSAAGVKDRAAAEYKMFLEKRPDHPEKAKFQKYIKDNSK